MSIDPSNISVVVQGPIDARLTVPCLASIRRHLPGAEVILSTWKGSDVPQADVDQVVLSDDPGGARCGVGDLPNMYNLNRQIVSTVAGLKRATRPLAMKIRTDMEVTGTGFLQLFEQFPARSDELRVFQRRVVSCTSATHSVRRRGYNLHPSDWFHFGLREDLLTLWDVPLDHGHEVARYFANRPRPVPDRLKAFIYRYSPEQYVWLHCLRKSTPVDMDHLGDNRPGLRRTTDLSFANNFVFADERLLGVHFRKYKFGAAFTATYLTFDEWKMLYRRHCDPAYRGVSWPRVLAHHAVQTAQMVWYRGTGRLAWAARKIPWPGRRVALP